MILFSNPIHTITTLATFDSVDDAQKAYVALPLINKLVQRKSFAGIISCSWYSICRYFSKREYQAIRFQTVVTEIATIFENIIHCHREETRRVVDLQKGHSHNELSCESHYIEKYSWKTQVVCGACLDPEYHSTAQKVVSLLFVREQKEKRNIQLQLRIASHALVETISGVFSSQTKKILKKVDFWSGSEESIPLDEDVRAWINIINSSTISILSSQILVDLFSVSMSQEDRLTVLRSDVLSSSLQEPFQQWNVAWKLYQLGLHIGVHGCSAVHNISGHLMPHLNTCLKVEPDLTQQTAQLGIRWFIQSSFYDSSMLQRAEKTKYEEGSANTSIIVASFPLLLGLWWAQKQKADFLFNPISMQSISPDGLRASVIKPICTLGSPRFWKICDDSALNLAEPKEEVSLRIAAGFFQKISSLSYTPYIDPNQYVLMPSKKIASLCPLKKNYKDFSWCNFEKYIDLFVQGDHKRKRQLYTYMNIWDHPDVVWSMSIFKRYGLQAQEADIYRECRLSQYQLQTHATKTLIQEVMLALTYLQFAYHYILSSYPHMSEQEFIKIYEKIQRRIAVVIPTTHTHISLAILQELERKI